MPSEASDEQPGELITVGQTGGKEKGSDKGEIKVENRQKYFRITKIKGGFKIIPGDLPFESELRLRISTGYDLRKGNPLTKYVESDFLLEKAPIRFKDSLYGVNIISVEKNQILLDVTDLDFQLVVTGFDDKRDLFIRAQIEEVEND